MFPTFLSELAALDEEIRLAMEEKRNESLGFVGSMPHRVYREGDKHGQKHSDGSSESRAFKQIDNRVEKSFEALMTMTRDDYIGMFSSIGQSFGEQMQTHIMEVIDESLEKNNQVVKAKASDQIEETILLMLSKVDAEFDENRQLTSQFVVPPQDVEKFENALRRLLTEPEFRSRFEVLFAKKYEEFRDRQANYRLVD